MQYRNVQQVLGLVSLCLLTTTLAVPAQDLGLSTLTSPPRTAKPSSHPSQISHPPQSSRPAKTSRPAKNSRPAKSSRPATSSHPPKSSHTPKPSNCSVIVNPTTTSTLCGSTPLPSGYVNATIPDFLKTNVTGDCANGEAVNPDCWDTLQLANYTSWWWGTFGSHCPPNTGFGDCFYSLSTGSAASCTQMNKDHCPQPQSNNFSAAWQGVRDFYLRNTIYNINGFFISYHDGVGSSQSLASGSVGQITQIINPPQDSSSFLADLLTALSAGLALITAPEAAPAFVGALLAAAKQVPKLAQMLFPNGNEIFQQDLMQWAKVSDELSKVTQVLQESIANATGVALGDPDTFVSLASSKTFTNLTVPDKQQFSSQILPQLYAYIVSQLLATNNYVLTRTLDTDVNALQSNGTSLNWDTKCHGYASDSTCGTFWYDNQVHHTYALMKADDPRSDTTDLQKQLYQYVPPEILLRGAQQCADSHGDGSKRYSPTIDVSKGVPGFNCMSTLVTCTWSMQAQLNHYSDDCKVGYESYHEDGVITNFVIPEGIGGDIVPLQYLGWGVLNNDAYHNTGADLQSEGVYM